DISPIQIIIVLVIALLVFGPRRLPEMGRNIGRGLREFKSSIADFSFDEPASSKRRAADPAQIAEPVSDEAPSVDAPTDAEAGVDPDDDLEGIVVPGEPPPR
ncbi:MAG: twin-arginine translocase TatA/TatE family subunit, partial [Thermoleophilia bacterium]|nr:twin-arginine translocase TatA/TatE family subunit [Thermoleophilia bacterium]